MKQQETVNNEISQASRELASKHFLLRLFIAFTYTDISSVTRLGDFFIVLSMKNSCKSMTFIWRWSSWAIFIFWLLVIATPRPSQRDLSNDCNIATTHYVRTINVRLAYT